MTGAPDTPRDCPKAAAAALAQVALALAEVKAGQAAVARAVTGLEAALEVGLQEGLQSLPACTALPSEHRRAHRFGTPRKIDGDPELQAFIAARVDRLTFEQIAAEVAAHFPPARHVRKTAIWDWWKRRQAGP